jgi:hypothetical protein
MRFGRGDVVLLKSQTQRVFYHVDSHEFKKELIAFAPIFFSNTNRPVLKVCVVVMSKSKKI